MKILRSLIVEDSNDDAALVLRHLSNAGYDVQATIVQTAQAMKTALAESQWDIVLADYTMPRFTGLDALSILKESGLDIPIIIISGTIGEDIAVQAMLVGVNDYLMKGNLKRLVPAIEREIHNRAERQARQNAEQALRQSEASLANAQRIACVGSWDWDLENNQLTWSAETLRIFGFTEAQFEGSYADFFKTVQPEDRQRIQHALGATLPQTASYNAEHEIVRPDGEKRMVREIGEVIFDASGKALRLSGLVQDITERKAAEDAIRQRDQLLKGIFDSVSSEIVVVDANGIISHVSNSWLRFARDNNAVMERVGVGTSYFEVCEAAAIAATTDAATAATVGDTSARMVLEGLRAVLEGRKLEFVLEYPCHSPTAKRWFKIQIDPRSKGSDGAVITHTDITESKLAAIRIAHEAFHDALTGLPNRALLIEHMHQAMARTGRHKKYLYALLFLDLDRFKFINDTLGHAAGDEFLIRVARKLESSIRPEDIVARYSGDEFAILLSDIGSIKNATRIARRINKELEQPFSLASGHNVVASASTGITLSKDKYISSEEVLRDADTAMYRAKSRGGGRYEIFDPRMQASMVALLKLETDLRLAVERSEFCLHYQPIVSLEDNRITAFEALVRWRHPERGLLLPEEFIPLAEETGLIIPIGKWVLRKACRELMNWQASVGKNLDVSINVNLSGQEFSQIGLIDQVSSVLNETGLAPNRLELEITETSMMDQSPVTTRMLWQLKELGVKLDIDDFGIGYSSLSRLHNFPVDVLKIDRSFVKRMGPGNANLEIVQTIVQLAHNLGMKVTAEGVETAEQFNQLRALGCESGQGYYFSRPVDNEQAKRMILL